MKSSHHEYLIAILAILVVFACGYGIGGRIAARRLVDVPPNEVATSWEVNVLMRLNSELSLDEAQSQAVRAEVAASAHKIDEVKMNARRAYLQELLDLHRRIEPLLDESQRERLEKSRAALQHRPAPGVSR
jgi:hypothetical protein